MGRDAVRVRRLGYLLRRYDASTVAPFSPLVPVAAMATAWLFRGEAVSPLRAIAAVLVIAGMAATVLRRTPAPVRTTLPGTETAGSRS